jgi:hypothetical protein
MIPPFTRTFAAAAVLAPLALSSLLVASPARAADAEAQALFDDGKRLLARGDVATACERFERSQRIEPAGGTLLYLARCNEDLGKTATAWTLFNEALSAARSQGRKDREQVAAEHLALLGPRLMRLRIVVKSAASIPQLTVTRDGKPLDAAGWGVAVPVDPGAHEIEASAPGYRAHKATIVARKEGSVVDVSIPRLDESAGAAAARDGARPPPRSDASLSTQETLAVVAGGVGVVGVGLGAYFGLRASSQHTETDRLCGGPAPQDCPQAGIDSANQAQGLGTASTVSFVVGALGLVGGAVLWFTAPSRRSSDVTTSLLGGRVRVAF